MGQNIRSIFLVISVTAVAVIFCGGCQEEQTGDLNANQVRLITSENRRLEEEKQELTEQLEKLQSKMTTEVSRLQSELKTYKEKNQALEQEIKENIDQKVSSVLSIVILENSRLRTERDELNKLLIKLQMSLGLDLQQELEEIQKLIEVQP
jgi:outer membrane murein-binding lipoprotein Lpp